MTQISPMVVLEEDDEVTRKYKSPEERHKRRCRYLPFWLRVFGKIDKVTFWKCVDLVRSQGLDCFVPEQWKWPQ
jgi:hypothetical protein